MRTSLRVLIVEDLPDDAELMARRLEEEGFQPDWRRVESEPDYLGALETIPDLILADWHLPHFSGLRALELMRERGMEIPFIVVSGRIGEEAAVDVLHRGADDYVWKDRPARLGQAARSALEKKRLREEQKRAEDALRQSEERFRHISSAISDIAYSCMISPDGEYLIDWMAGATERITGYTAEEIKEHGCWSFLVVEEDLALFEKHVTDLAPGSSGSCELRIRHKNGHIEWVASYADCVLEAGEPRRTRLYGGLVDITTRKRAEEALSQSHQELQQTLLQLEQSKDTLQLVIESIPIRVFWKDLDLRYLGSNTLFARDAGLSHPQEVLGKDDFAMGWKNEAEIYRADDRGVIESRQPRLNLVEPQTTPQGTRIWLKTSKVPLQMPDGEVFGVLGVYEDITERKLAEEALKDSEERFKIIFEFAPDAYYLSDLQGNFTGGNLAAERITGYKREEMIGASFLKLNLLSPDQVLKAADLLAVNAQGEATGPDEFVLKRKDGSQIVVEIMTFPVKIKGVTAILGIARDISQRKRDEEQLKAALDEREVMLREIHHRVKNNMQIISSLLRLQSQTITDKKTREIFNESQSRIRSIAFIHEKLYQSRDYSRVEFADYVRKTITHLFALYEIPGGRISFKVEAEDVYLDIGRAIPCGLIINELVTNSLKHAFPGKRKGEIIVRISKQDGAGYRLTVKDTGIGLPGDFDPEKQKTLGFQIIRDLVRQIEGSMTIKKEPGTEIIIQF